MSKITSALQETPTTKSETVHKVKEVIINPTERPIAQEIIHTAVSV